MGLDHLFTRGKGLPIRSHAVPQAIITEDLPQVIEARRRAHSEKPDEAYATPERLFGNVRWLDMYSRQRRPGWTSWSNDLH